MKVNWFNAGLSILLLVCGFVAFPAYGDDFTWDGGPLGTGTDVSDPLNWNPDGSVHLPTQTNAAHFGAVGSTTPTLGDTDFWVTQFIFDAGAQAYTFTANSGPLTYVSTFAPAADSLANYSAHQQVLNITTGKIGVVGLINPGTTAGGSLVINGALSVSDGSSSGAFYTGLAGSNNVYFNVDTSINAAGDVNGGTWTSSATSSMYSRARGRFSIANFSGTAFLGNIGTEYTGTFHLDSTVNGAVRLTHNNSLGAPGGIVDNVQTNYYDAVQIYGGTTGNATLELVNNITVARSVFNLDGRSEGVANDPHILNISGDNTINVTADWNTGIVAPITTASNGGDAAQHAGNWNIQSDSGKLTITSSEIDGGNFYNTANVAITVQLMGAGDGQFDSPWLTYLDNPSFDVVKKGTGTWTYNNATTAPPANTGLFSGTVDIQQGTFSLGTVGNLPGASTIAVKSGAVFKVSDLLTGGEYTLGATQTLKGAGSVDGSIVSNTGSFIAPGDSVGTLTLSGPTSNLTLGGGNTLQFELSNNPLGANDKIVVGGGLTLGNGGPINIAITALNNALGNGVYHLINYTGALTDFGSSFQLSGVGGATTRQSFTVDTSVAQQINLNVSGSAASLTWAGGNNSNAWDLVTTVNWTGAPAPTFDNRFYDGDSVTFTDTGSNVPNVNVVGTLSPAAVTFSNTSSHNYTLQGGTIAVSGTLTTGSTGNVTFSNADISAAGINAGGSGNLTFGNANVSVAGNFNSAGSANVNFNNVDLSVTGTFTVNGTGKVTIANTGGLSLPATITVNSGTLALNRADNITVTNAIAGAGTLRKEGANVVTVSGSNTGLTGTVVVAKGTLLVDHGNTNALGTGAGGTTVLNGATLDLNGTNLANEVVTIEGAGVGGIGALYDSRGSGAAAADLSHIKGVIMSGDATIAAAGNSFMFIDGAGATFQGNGHDLAVVASDAPSGSEVDIINVGDMNVKNLDVSGGAYLYIGGNTTLGPTSGTLTLQDSTTLGIYASLTGTSASTGTIDKPIRVTNTANGGGIIVYRGLKTIASPITMNGNLDVTIINSNSSTTGTATLTGKLTGAGGLSMHLSASTTTSRLGLVQLTSNDNDYTGPTTIGGGGGLEAVGATTDRVSLSIGNGGNTGSIGTGDITINGVSNRVFLYFNRGGTYTVPNNIITAGTDNNAQLDAIHPLGDVTLSGVISGPGRIFVEAGTMTFSGNNTNTGVTTVDFDSQLVISSNNALGAVGDENASYSQPLGGAGKTNALVLTNNINTGEFLWLGARDTLAAHIKNRSGDNTISGTIQADLVAGLHKYALQSDGTAAGDIFRISGNIQTPNGFSLGGVSTMSFQGAGKGAVSGKIIEQFSNVMNVEKNGDGTWTLSGANTYTGTTTVNAGTLLVNGTHTGGAYTVSGGTLGGTGTITAAGGVSVLAAGTLAPGASVGTLSVVGNVSIAGALGIEVSGTSIDRLAVTGGLTLGAGSVLDIQGNLATAITHVIATYNAGSLVGTFTNALDATTHGYNVVYNNDQIILDELDGDANHDGTVNIFDINLVSANWSPVGPVTAFAPGNTNHDSVINIFDINLISANWNHVATNGGVAHAQAVPEPSSVALLSLGLLGLVLYVRRGRK